VQDELCTKIFDPLERRRDTLAYPTLKEPPPIGVSMKTDSSVITTNTYEDLNSVREFNRLESIDRTYYKDYYWDTHTIKEEGIFEDGYCFGLWKYYDKKGTLYKEIDFETGNKRLYGGGSEPYDDVLLEMRTKGDSILKACFGSAFFERYIQWDPSHSYYHSENGHGSWFDVPAEKPEEFRLRYFVSLERRQKHSTIEFKLDRKGRIMLDGGAGTASKIVDRSQPLHVVVRSDGGNANALQIVARAFEKAPHYYIFGLE
jgi:hypothetical protein